MTSAWVSANAGAGKTRLLTSRVLRLLLSGVLPPRILCITYTSAAAAEMKSRIHAELSRWAVIGEEELIQALTALSGHAPDLPTLTRARVLFTTVLEAPEGLRIQTIHAFCQSLLRRFPLEAEVPPYFAVLDERAARELIHEAAMRLYLQSISQETPVTAALRFIAGRLSEYAFHDLIGELIAERRLLHELFYHSRDMGALAPALYRALGLEPRQTLAGLMTQQFSYGSDEALWLERAGRALVQGTGNGEAARGALILRWLTQPESRTTLYEDYRAAFLTLKGEKRARLCTKATLQDDALIEALQEEQERVWRFEAMRKSLHIAEVSREVLTVAEGLVALYEALKSQRGALDYDDLILLARDLLRKPGIAPWVLYKLDGGIDHLLLDEAQDTSPEQWDIVCALTEEFFAGQGVREGVERTLFVVGDEKQSIYSFQGADPEAFQRMRAYFEERITAAGKPFIHAEMLKSYRSSAPVLQSVDVVFQNSPVRNVIRHELTRIGEAGRVEIWPLAEPEEKPENAPWELPLTGRQLQAPAQKLAQCVADGITRWIAEGKLLPSKGRAVQPGDIMVLVRRRTGFVDALIRALKRQNIPVAGMDRMALTENLAVQDMMALASFTLMPGDDLSLACVLRSPLFNVSDAGLFTLAHGRGEASLWERLQQSAELREAADCLHAWMQRARQCTPYAFFAHVLEASGVRRKLTGRMGEEHNDALDEFLSQALAYERQHIPSLQGFLQWLTQGGAVIKRDMEHGVNAVRILTVHGAKGLQAPVVILPDTTQIPTSRERILWMEREGEPDLLFWSPSSAQDDATLAALRAGRREAMMREYRRLLYVAMTRAEDELYLCGYKGSREVSEESWYAQVKKAIMPLAEECETVCGSGLCLHAPQEAAAKAKRVTSRRQDAAEEVPEFLTRRAPPETVQPLFRLFEKRSQRPTPLYSPLTQDAMLAKGRVMHALLQRLPDIAPDKCEAMVELIIRRVRPRMPVEERSVLTQEAIQLTQYSRWAFLFQPGGLAEVPVAGYVDGLPVTLEIDRLVTLEQEVWGLFYDLFHPPPVVEELSAPMRANAAAAQALLSALYPDKRVRVLAIWPGALTLREITERESVLT